MEILVFSGRLISNMLIIWLDQTLISSVSFGNTFWSYVSACCHINKNVQLQWTIKKKKTWANSLVASQSVDRKKTPEQHEPNKILPAVSGVLTHRSPQLLWNVRAAALEDLWHRRLRSKKDTPDHLYSSHCHRSRDDITLWLQLSTSSLMRLLPRRSYRDNDWAMAYLLEMKRIGKCLGRNFPCKLFKCILPEILFHSGDSYFLWWYWGRKNPQRQNISRASIIKEAPTMSTQHSH